MYSIRNSIQSMAHQQRCVPHTLRMVRARRRVVGTQQRLLALCWHSNVGRSSIASFRCASVAHCVCLAQRVCLWSPAPTGRRIKRQARNLRPDWDLAACARRPCLWSRQGRRGCIHHPNKQLGKGARQSCFKFRMFRRRAMRSLPLRFRLWHLGAEIAMLPPLP